jgi:hypothetical protein
MIRSAFALCCILLPHAALAQQSRLDPNRPFEIADNSFLVEEAFNQEAGVFQNILLIQRPDGRNWSFEFTQEWPVGSIRHQLSYTIPVDGFKSPLAEGYDFDRGTIAVNYRYQLTMEEQSGYATSPRISLLVPRSDFGDNWGVQLNLPFSKQFGNAYLHLNAGLTNEGDGAGNRDTRWHTAGSVIYRVWPMVHLMVESVYRADEREVLAGMRDVWLLSPGFRAGINLGEHQLVLGAAVPMGLLDENDSQDFIAYISYELPFMRR